MIVVWMLTAAAQCLLLWRLWRAGRDVVLGLVPDGPCRGASATAAGEELPPAALIVPVAGSHPRMESALRSLLRQDYPGLLPVLVTADADDPATALIARLREEFPHIRQVIAGPASGCGQKNRNLLQGVAAVGDAAEIYLFCDSTHEARPDFARRLARPVAEGESAFATGYHYVDAGDDRPVTLAYQLSVLLMRLLQAVSVFTQPWGGAMAISRRAFERRGIAAFWRDKVVDDCSLAGLLLRCRLGVTLCGGAVLRTVARDHSLPVWRAWMDRQVLFLKFCVPGQWVLLGVFALLMAAPAAVSLAAVAGGLSGLVPDPAFLFGLVHLTLLCAVVLGWRELLPRKVPALRWLGAFALGVGMFCLVYLRSIPARTILWHGRVYRVGRGGRVL